MVLNGCTPLPRHQGQGAPRETTGNAQRWQAGAAVTAQVRHWLDELEDPGSVRGAVDRLVAWLMEREPKEG